MKKYYFRCPRCQNDDRFHRVNEEASGTGLALLIFGGFLPALIFASQRTRRIQCAHCNYIFRHPPVPQSSVARLSKYIFIVMLISGFPMFIFSSNPELAHELRNVPYLNIATNIIKISPMGVAISMGIMIFGILVLITGAWGISTYRLRKELKAKYKVSPEANAVIKNNTNEGNSVDAELPSAE